MNYVLFYPDEMRPESLACYGHPLIRTPNLDRLAAEGTVFETAYSAHPVCLASRAALATGLYPHVYGHRTLRYHLNESYPNCFKYLRAAGIRTCLAAKNHCFTEAALAQSFDSVVPFLRPGEDLLHLIDHGEGVNNYAMLMAPMSKEGGDHERDAYFVDEGIEFINESVRDGQPFFLFQSLINPHPSYTAPQPYYDMYDPEQIPPLRDLGWLDGKPELYSLIRKYRELDLHDDSLFRKINAIYLGMISYTDMLLGRIIGALEDNGVYDDTTVIVLSDHGDFAGDAGLVEKWPSAVDDMLTRVPMIVRRSGMARGHRVTEPVQSIDLFPTICELEGIVIEHDQFGISLRRQLEGGRGDPDRAVYCEGGYDEREPQAFEGRTVTGLLNRPGSQYYPKGRQQQERPESVCRVVMQRDARFKLNVRTNGENELYDLVNDPLEYHNVYDDPDYQVERDQRVQRMLGWLIHTSDVIPRTDNYPDPKAQGRAESSGLTIVPDAREPVL